MARRLLNDCFLHDKERMRHDEAVALLRERLQPITGEETAKLSDAHGRILARDVIAPRPVPAYDNAAVDGYAFAHDDYVRLNGRLAVSQRIAAGHPSDNPIKAGHTARIFTGAAIPAGTDSVAMQEDVAAVGDNSVEIPAGLKKGANTRLAGEDLKAGSPVVAAGTVLRPQDMAAIASTGAAEITCHKRLRVALLSTGDEIVSPGNELRRGQVFDSNHAMLSGLLAPLGVAVTRLGILSDKADLVRRTIETAAADHDVIITTGGASRGEEDHIVATLDEIGSLAMWQLAIKPGRPMNFGQIGDCAFMGLPGNPVAVMVCFLLYVRPALRRLAGGLFGEPRRFPVAAAFTMRKKPDRREFLRGILRGSGCDIAVERYPRDGSGLISSLRAADGLIEIDEATTSVSPGDCVNFVPFGEFVDL